MEIWTSQLSNWRRIKAFGIDIVDITAKSGLHWFAPEYQHVMEYKNGLLTETEYTDLYIAKMRQSFIQYKANWILLKNKKDVAYVCYCKYEENGHRVFCHRHIFVDLLSRYLTKEGVPHVLKGELR
jgi:hypothetical protein